MPPPPPRPTGSGRRVMPPAPYEEETTSIQRSEETSPIRSHVDVEIARAGVDVAAWPAELTALARNARQLSERDATRGALLFGAVSVLAATLSEFDQAHDALQSAARLSRERWIATIRRRRAWQARDFDKALEAAREELDQVGEPRERVALLIEVAAL